MWIIDLQKSVNYIEEHLLDNINYEDAARHVNMSCYNFHRAFSFVTGMTANEYIRNRRLSLAGQELASSDCRITDIAFKYGYDTPESFTKAFTRFHGISPSNARKSEGKLCLFNPFVIEVSVKGGNVMDYRIEETSGKKCIALVRQFEIDSNDISAFWKECHDKGLVEPIRDLRPDGMHDLYGLCAPFKSNDKFYNYGIGVIVDESTLTFDEDKMIKAGYTMWNIEPGTYVVLKCYGTDTSCIREMWNRFYKEFLPETGYESRETSDYEIYFECGEEGLFCEIHIPVIRK